MGFLHTQPPTPPSQLRYRGGTNGGSSGGGGSSSSAGARGSGSAGAAGPLLVHNCLCGPCWERLREQGQGARCPVCNQRAPGVNVVRT